MIDLTNNWNDIRRLMNNLFSDKIDSVIVVTGLAEVDDAFTFKNHIIALTLNSFLSNYGSVNDTTNKAKLSRIFQHELSHLYAKRWMQKNPVKLTNPFSRALWECWYEGIGNYFSLSNQWKTIGQNENELVTKTLNELVPIFTTRMIALSTASVENEPQLIEGLSRGQFSKK